MNFHHRRSFHIKFTPLKDEQEKLDCAKAWYLILYFILATDHFCRTKWEMATSRLYVDPEYVKQAEADEFAVAFASISPFIKSLKLIFCLGIESHYFVNGGFLKSTIVDSKLSSLLSFFR